MMVGHKKMNFNLKNTLYAILPITIIIPSILFISDYIYFQEPLSRIALCPDDPKCDAECVEKINDSYKCVEIKPPARVCSEIIYPNRANTFLSIVFQTPYMLSNMTFHNSLPEDYVKVLPVTEYGRK